MAHKFPILPFEFEIGEVVETSHPANREQTKGIIVARFYKGYNNSRWYVVEGYRGDIKLYSYYTKKPKQ